MSSKKSHNQITNLDLTAFALVQQYCKLSKIMNPSDEQFKQMMMILDLAQYDAELCSLINEADHLIAYELGLSKGISEDTPLEDYSVLGK